MITIIRVPDADWPALAGQFQDWTFEQSLTYGQAAAARIGGRVQYLALEQGGRLVAAAAVRIKTVPGLGRGIAWIASGPLLQPRVGPEPDAVLIRAVFEALRDELALRQGHILRLRLAGIALNDPEKLQDIATEAGFVSTNRAQGYHSLAINLHCTADVLMSNLNGKWRTDLRYALKSGLSLETGRGPDLEARFLALFRDTQTTKGFQPDITPEFHFALAGPDLRHDILIATKDGQDLAGIVIGTTGLNAVYLFGATAHIGRSLRAGYFLTWEGILLSQMRGLDWYDLGGVDFDANPDVARFKDRMNGVKIDAAGPFEVSSDRLVPRLVAGLEGARAYLRRGAKR